MKFTLLKLLLLTAAIAVAVWFVNGLYVELTHIDHGEGVASVPWLPESASNISFYRSYMYTAYEFDISEQDFSKWTWLDVAEISTPVTITRYKTFTTKIPELSANPTASELLAHQTAYDEQSATISDGLYYESRRNNGGGVMVCYDRKIGRAFLQTNPR